MMRKQSSRGLLVCLAMLTAALPCLAATEIDGRPNNPYGVQLGMVGSDHSDYVSIHMQWAADMIGEWGHVRVGSGLLDYHEAVRTLVMCRAKKLTPVSIQLFVHPDYWLTDGRLDDSAPELRDDGYPLSAEVYRAWAAMFAELGAYPPYYEIANEVNGKWDEETYARFFIGMSEAIQSELPDLNMVTAGLAGYGGDFLAEALRKVPEMDDHAYAYGLHPYGANHPPSYDEDNYCLRGHFFTAADLATVGVHDPKFVMTESGYELGNKKDPRFPRITDELRAEYLVEAYETFWVPDPRVVCLTLFILQVTNHPGWNGWILVNNDNTFTETYKALAAVPKPQGSDWMPQGPGRIGGRIVDAVSGLPGERVFVYTVPGLYAAETDDNGEYAIEHLPLGEYEVRMFRDGFRVPSSTRVDVTEDTTPRVDGEIHRVSLIAGDFDTGTDLGSGWIPEAGWDTVDGHYAVDYEIKRTGAGSQRLHARPQQPVNLWNIGGNASAVPDMVYAAEVWVKGRGVKIGEGQEGVSVTLSITDGGGTPMSNATVSLPPNLEGDFDWTPLTATIAPTPLGRRVRMTISFDAQEGTIWLDDAYVHYAHYPVSSRQELGEGTASLRGEVMTQDAERIPGAMVSLRPGNIWTRGHSDGRFVLENVPPGTYDLWAFAEGWQSAARFNVEIEGDMEGFDIGLSKPPAPREVQNPGFEEAGPHQDYTPGWIKYGEQDGFPRSGWHPEVYEHPEGFQARSGEGFAGTIAGSNIKNGGIYQVLEVTPNQTYTAGVWSYTFQTRDGQRGEASSRLGLDPTGGADPEGPYVIWTPYRPSHKEWTHVTLSVSANTDRMTLFLDHKQVVGLTYLVNMWDDVTFEATPGALPAALDSPHDTAPTHQPRPPE